MNWPQLSPESSRAIAEVLKDVVHSKPKDLFEHVAQQLQERSGLNPKDFEEHFEECKRKPRTYTLEERCPPNQDPFSWVPMRYNDDTILLILSQRATELASDILSQEPMESTQVLLDRACASFPELMYTRDSPQELAAFQTLRAIYLGFSGRPDVLVHCLDDAEPMLAFRCEALIESAREHLFEPSSKSTPDLEAVILCCVLRILGSHAGFRKRFGGDLSTPELAALHAIEHEPQSLPSFQRMSESHKRLIVSVLQVYFPLEMLVTSEAAPAHFLQVKDTLAQHAGDLPFYLATVTAEHVVNARRVLVPDEAVDLLRLGTQCLMAVEKYSASRAYELFLKKRAERHSWRLVKDDFIHRAIVRLCCFAGQEDTEAWSDMMKTVEELSDHEREVLKVELGRKDGLAESPVFVPLGGSTLLSQASTNSQLSVRSLVRLLIRVLEDSARTFDRMLNHRTVKLHLGDLAVRAREYGGGAPFEDLPFVLEELGAGEVAARAPGTAS